MDDLWPKPEEAKKDISPTPSIPDKPPVPAVAPPVSTAPQPDLDALLNIDNTKSHGGSATHTPPEPPPSPPAETKKKKGKGIPKVMLLVVLLLGLSLPALYIGAQKYSEIRSKAASTVGLPDDQSSGCCHTDSQCQGWFGSISTCTNGNGACASGLQCKGGSGNGGTCTEDCNGKSCGTWICNHTIQCNGSCTSVCNGDGICGNGESVSTCPQDCKPDPTATPRPTGGGSCVGALQPCTPGATSGLSSCCSGQNLYCQTPAGGGQAVCQQDDGSGANCGPGGSCTGVLAFKCSSLDGSGRCEQNPQSFSSWQDGVNYARGCGQVDRVCVGGTRPNTLCGDFQIISSSCGGGGGNTHTPTQPTQNTPTRTPTPTVNPQCGGNCSGNAQCPNNHTCSGGKCVLTACLNNDNTCSDDNCTVINSPTPTNTPTPTTITGQCENIKIYKGNEVVNPNTLKPGDQIVIAVVGTNATKARVRVNGGTFTEITEKNSNNEYTYNFTIPRSGQFTIEAEVYIGGTWR